MREWFRRGVSPFLFLEGGSGTVWLVRKASCGVDRCVWEYA